MNDTPNPGGPAPAPAAAPEPLSAILAEMRAAVRDSFASKLVAEYEETGRLDEAPAAQALKDDDDYIASLADRIEVAVERERAVDENTSDGYHTFRELYRYRMLYNAAFFNMLSRHTGIAVVKSRRHGDGEPCFGGGWFIVMAQLPTGQISNHYEDRYWGLFCVPEIEMAPKWDGHTPNDAADRLESFREMRKPDSDRSNPPGNAAAMREALDDAHRMIEAFLATVGDRGMRSEFIEMRHRIDAALSAPPRNCDVGTADEQAERFEAECRRHDHCTPCPVFSEWREFKEGKTKSCKMIWAQMPYKAEGFAE